MKSAKKRMRTLIGVALALALCAVCCLALLLTAAAAPSPKRMQVCLSVKSQKRDIASLEITRTYFRESISSRICRQRLRLPS